MPQRFRFICRSVATGVFCFMLLAPLVSGARAEQPLLSEGGGAAENAVRGKDLYVGTRAFAEGGSPCLACHAIAGAGLGLAEGASYGPDLTGLHGNYGGEGVASILETLPFPSMEPIYGTRPLTEGERADLSAFFATVGGAQPAALEGKIILHASGALLVLVMIFHLFGRGRLRGVRRSLIEKARQPSAKGETR